MEPGAPGDGGVLGRAKCRQAGRRPLYADARRHAPADELFTGSLGGQLHAVRHRQRFDRREHTSAVDLPASRRPVRGVQPQRTVVARSLAPRFESALDQTSVRVADVNTLAPGGQGRKNVSSRPADITPTHAASDTPPTSRAPNGGAWCSAVNDSSRRKTRV